MPCHSTGAGAVRAGPHTCRAHMKRLAVWRWDGTGWNGRERARLGGRAGGRKFKIN